MAQCKGHPKTETNLFCGKCGDPICPKCRVQTPVGARCPTCARLSRVPTYQVSGKYYLRAIGAALGPAAGFAIGEGITFSVNRKAGLKLAVIGGIAVVCAYLIATFTFRPGHFSLIDILAVALGIFVSVSRLR